jgi:hypothetical protein
MKKILTAILLILCISCKKDDVKMPPPAIPVGNPNNKMEADIMLRGQNKHMLSDYTTLVRQDYSFTARYTDTICLAISGSAYSTNGDSENEISIFLTNIKDTGTYVFGLMDSGRIVEILYQEPSPCGSMLTCLGPYYLANSGQNEGQLIIERISDKKIKGKFQATGYPVYYNDSSDIAKMTSGSFEGDIP